MTRFTLDHIDISAFAQPRSYKSPSSNPRRQRTQRIREEHGPRLIDEYDSAFDAALADRPKGEDGQPEPDGVVLEVELAPRAPVTDLSRIRENTRQGTTRIDPVTGAQKIALIVPDEKRGVMEALIDEYAHGPLIRRDNKPDRAPNEDRIARIEHFRKGTFETFWKDDLAALPEDPATEMWWALWCFPDAADRVIEIARQLGCRIAEPDAYLRFPDIVVIPVHAPKLNIEILLFGALGIAEVRRASDSPTFYLSDVRGDR